ncbi:MAG: hypothetical protein HOM21_09190, partial [Halobacteriovoraceae bacterium]|nr:hypothetical protein [Halobacteriovoraceae bacterium]
LAEVQQNSGVTYRVWDWNRLDDQGNSRELHIQKAMDVINFESAFNKKENFDFKQNLFRQQGKIELVDHPDFHLDIVVLKAGEEVTLTPRQNARPSAILSLGPQFRLAEQTLNSYSAALLLSGEALKVAAIESNPGAFLYVS